MRVSMVWFKISGAFLFRGCLLEALDAPKEPRRCKTHWDHVLEEMIWLSKDFEAERKWKLAQAKRVAIRASKGFLDQAIRGEKKVKEEEHRLRKVAANISKEVKKFWVKIEKLASRSIQPLRRYSTMLAENLTDMPIPSEGVPRYSSNEQAIYKKKEGFEPDGMDDGDDDDDFSIQSDDELEDDEHTIEADEALITEEERREELEALQNETHLPLEELLNRYSGANNKFCREGISSSKDNDIEVAKKEYDDVTGSVQHKNLESDLGKHLYAGNLSIGSDNVLSFSGKIGGQNLDPVTAVQAGRQNEVVQLEHGKPSNLLSEDSKMQDAVSPSHFVGDAMDDKDYVIPAGEERDDEATLDEEEELAKSEMNDPINEIRLLEQESEIPIEELLAHYKKERNIEQDESGTEFASCEDELESSASSGGEPYIHSQEGCSIDDNQVKNEDFDLLKAQSSLNEEMDDGFGEKPGENENRIADAAEAARSAQPTGNTFSTTKVRTKFPFLLKHPLREYQHIGLDWLVTMYEKRLNGILADEMGLGKTIMTIALLAHLACDKGIWGPHLIVVPTSVMLNWETEFLKWCPAFKILTYFGSAKERKFKRQGWMKVNSFHVCITTYRLVIQDSKVFKRKKWKYLILDEAHLIKNWKSQRWQTLLNFNSKRRILLTGTPLQNDLMELWSLMHFLMPHLFQSHQEFKDWFCNPISVMVEGQEKVNKEVIDRLHNVLRPFILRRLKRDVEKQLPKKYEHVIYCRLSRRQRNLYEDFIASSETQATLASANFFGMISVIMQLRKVCNHPDLFEGRPIISSYDMVGIDRQLSSSICGLLSYGPFSKVDLLGLSMLFTHLDFSMTSWEHEELVAIATPPSLIRAVTGLENVPKIESLPMSFEHKKRSHGTNIFEDIRRALCEERIKQARERAASVAWWNSLRCRKKPLYGTNLRELVTVRHPVYDIHQYAKNPLCYLNFSSKLAEIVLPPVDRLQRMLDVIERFMFAIPAARSPPPTCWCSKKGSSPVFEPTFKEQCGTIFGPLLMPIRPAIVRRQVYFPDRRLIQFDCGKLQELAILLRRLKSEGHRALIFTQMTKMLDILEAFINLYGYTYMRLDGSTQPEQRQTLMQRFNTNPKIFLFILSTRSGGVGINLVGADTVIFYDSDWNPAMDQQAQDRCHRIGQTREVHIYRLVSVSTIEENILKKANQKRALDDLVIQSGSYNTEFFKKLDPMELFSGQEAVTVTGRDDVLSNADVEAALKHVEDEVDYMALKKVEEEEAVDNQEFTEEAIGKLEEDEFVNEDDAKFDEKIPEVQSISTVVKAENETPKDEGYLKEDGGLILAGGGEDFDMLADVKQMAAAAAAAGQASSSFENQLRPIERYAMQFLDLWDPIIDRSSMDSQVSLVETEWDMEKIEKFKEDLEAEADDDDEPLVYERWDTDFATEAYRQHVKVLAQRQLMEELESEAQENEDKDDERKKLKRKDRTGDMKAKSKKKLKKAKFKSLKKGTLASDTEAAQKEPEVETTSVDEVVMSAEYGLHSSIKKKRKKIPPLAEEEKEAKKTMKKPKKSPVDSSMFNSDSQDKQVSESKDLKSTEIVSSPDVKPPTRNKIGGKVSITPMPIKRVLVIKPEKAKKKGNFRSKDFIPPPDSWSSREDAILCAIVHQYGAVWSLASDTLYSMPTGGFYRGRYRHPVHCLERFRELFFKCILSATENVSSEKQVAVAAKALLKVTEDHVQVLLDVASELPDNELLLQKHYTAVLSSVWRAKTKHDIWSNTASRGRHSHSNVCSSVSAFTSLRSMRKSTTSYTFSGSSRNSKLVAWALKDAPGKQQEESLVSSSHQGSTVVAVQDQGASESSEHVEITIEFLDGNCEEQSLLPSSISVSMQESVSFLQNDVLHDELLKDCSAHTADDRHRMASVACLEGECHSWATLAFQQSDVPTSRQTSKSLSTGKHKAVSDSIKLPKPKIAKNIDVNEESAVTKSGSAVPEDVHPKFPDAVYPVSPPPEFCSIFVEDTLDDVPPATLEVFEPLPQQYIPGIVSGLEEFQGIQDLNEILLHI
ncbi:PHOTOPERIOD-INDEPENDENT EARLY FLOWERING 1 protein [Nymphaea thermarum]|nr:PHOTOPERIOD-INDEPENDENT EARLY FLOWERING 1 protein [Nymphaea thermarum]